jgi:hypothetical protein
MISLHLNAVAMESQAEKKTVLSAFLKANPGPSIVYVTTHAVILTPPRPDAMTDIP